MTGIDARHHGRTLGALLVLAATLAGCGDAGGGAGRSPTAPATAATPACTAQVTLDLAPGQTRTLDASQAACMRIAGHGGARYVLAAFDPRAVENARRGPETTAVGDPTYRVDDGTGGPLSSAAPNASRAPAEPSPLAAPGGDLRIHASASAADDSVDPFRRATPWREGDRFPVKHVEGGDVVTARVAKVVDGRFVMAVVDADVPNGRFATDAAKALDYVARVGVPLLDRTFGERRPVTSAGSGQMLILLTAWNPDNGAGATWTVANPDGSGVFSYVLMNLNLRGGVRPGYEMYDFASFRLKVMAHELTHAWQMRYAYETQPGAAEKHVNMGPAWSMEGCADLVSLDVLRRYLGIGLASNWDWAKRIRAGDEGVIFALEPADQRGMLPRGYFDGSSFLRDLQMRMVRRGVDPDEALSQVARGAVEGWFGIDGSNVRRTGLADRVRAALGAAWEPAEAVLLWTATQAADDLTSNPDLNNPVYASVGDPDEQYAWKAAYDDVRLGRPFAHQFASPGGTSFFVRVSDDGPGGTLAARSSDGAVRWLLARVK